MRSDLIAVLVGATMALTSAALIIYDSEPVLSPDVVRWLEAI